MKKTLIISTFPTCGKTYLFENQMNYGYSILDIESSLFRRGDGWEIEYIDFIDNRIGKVDYILVSQHDEVLKELNLRKLPFITVLPNNSSSLSDRERQIIKQQWFGRFLLRNNSHIKNINEWLDRLLINYEGWTNIDHIMTFQPILNISLNADEYLSDKIDDIHVWYNNL